MGLEAACQARMGRASAAGKARLEETDLVFRGEGDLKFKVPLKDLRRVDARAGALYLEWAEGRAVLDLGDQAARWAEKIRSPPSLLDKLGVKRGQRVSVVGIEDREFLDQLSARVDDLTRGRARAGSDLVLVAMSDRADLPRLLKLREAIKAGGAIWVVWPKGSKEFREDDVRAYGPTAGLVDVKVARFSDTLSALKMMIPRAQR
ncbi:MAG: hypothetical protein DMF77_03210 [Acidobacteria bacterium]|nr:MAG: hypothetical protein DMF77_03210 [Acidobacteriota bacterium]